MKLFLYCLIACSLYACLDESRLSGGEIVRRSLGELGKTVQLNRDFEKNGPYLEFFFDQRNSKVGLYLWADSVSIHDSLFIKDAASLPEGSVISGTDYFKLSVPLMGGSGIFLEKTFVLSFDDNRITKSLDFISSYMVSIGDTKESYTSEVYKIMRNDCIVLSTEDGVSEYDTLKYSETAKVFYETQTPGTKGDTIYEINLGKYSYNYSGVNWRMKVN